MTQPPASAARRRACFRVTFVGVGSQQEAPLGVRSARSRLAQKGEAQKGPQRGFASQALGRGSGRRQNAGPRARSPPDPGLVHGRLREAFRLSRASGRRKRNPSASPSDRAGGDAGLVCTRGSGRLAAELRELRQALPEQAPQPRRAGLPAARGSAGAGSARNAARQLAEAEKAGSVWLENRPSGASPAPICWEG